MTLRFSQSPAARLAAAQFSRSNSFSRDRKAPLPTLVRGLVAGALGLAMFAAAPLLRAQTQAAPTPAAITPGGTVVEDVIARINDQIISRSDLERAQQQLDQEGRQQGIPPAEIAARQKDLLRDLIDQQLLLSKGKELGITGETELVKRLDDIRKQNKLDTMDDLEKAAAQQGVSFEDFKANIRNSIITQNVVRDEVGRRLQLSESDVQKYYDEHKQEFAQPESVHLSEILIPTPAPASGTPDDATVAKALATANSVEDKLKSGSDFADAARQYSAGTTAQQGGDLGDYKRGGLAQVLEDKTFSLPVGAHTDPIRTRQGYVILRVDAHTPGGVPPLADVQSQVEETIYTQQMQPALRAYLTRLREEAYIDISPGFVDSGASPGQTKPVYSAYAPPQAKKKKVAQKQRFDRRGRAAGNAFAASSAPAAPSSAAPSPAALLPADAASAAPAAALNGTPVASSTAPPTPAATSRKVKSSGKVKKVKREKVRFGQLPRELLPAAENSAEAPAPVTSANLGTSTMAAAVADTAAPSPLSDPNADPLAPKAVEVKKGRYSDRAKLPKPKKAAKQVDPLAPPPPSDQETLTQKAQAAPLGLGGDTAAKHKKKKRQKGDKKERFHPKEAPPVQQPSTAPSPLAAPGPAGAPLRGTPVNPSGEPLHGTPDATQTPQPPATTPQN